MSESDEEKKKNQMDEFLKDSDIRSVSSSGASGAVSKSRQLRKINPLGMRVVVHIRRDNSRTEAGLYLPEGAKQLMHESLLGEVVEVASAVDIDSDEEANISGVPEGALVLIRKDVGVKVPWDEDLRIVETKDVLAIVHEVEVI
jgi:co-chaperonin GroES (HSP10)